jgi:hypothetical protein
VDTKGREDMSCSIEHGFRFFEGAGFEHQQEDKSEPLQVAVVWSSQLAQLVESLELKPSEIELREIYRQLQCDKGKVQKLGQPHHMSEDLATAEIMS